MTQLKHAADIADELTRIPEGHWVALSQDESTICASAPTLEEAIELAARSGCAHPLVIKNYLGYIF
jgi:hypothetical protein